MKISLLAFATLAGIATAKDGFHLRSATSDGVTHPKGVDTTVFVKGLATSDVSEDDLKIIGESVVVAFNSIYGPSTGTLIVSAEDEVTNLGECGGWGCGGYDHNNPQHRRSRWWGFSGDWWACGWICPDDDAAAVLGKKANADAVLVMNRVKVVQTGSEAAALASRHLAHAKLEETICKALRTSGASNLANVKDCTLSFVATPGEAFGSLPVDVSCTPGNPVGVTFLVGGMPVDEAVTEEDAILVNKSIKDAWNQVFFGAYGSGMADMTVEPFVGSAGDSMIFSGHFEPLCPNSGHILPPSATQHAEFEKIICDKLVASGSSFWKNAKNCGFRTVARLE